jgi:endonuclease/exonuclease/phosphatase family metal-dependent hydrolase
VMNWNIKFGGARIDFFFDCFGDRVLMSRHEVLDHLDDLAAATRHFDPDVLLLQEVDVDAKRSDYIDQLQYLLDHTALNYGVYASQWRADFVPSDGLGAMDDGNAILSRWPLHDAQRIALARRGDQSAAERYFYLQRNILEVTTDIPGGEPLVLVNIHSDAYGKDGTKLQHITRFEQELARLDALGMRFVAGGDLNTLPPGSSKLSGFPDSVCKDEAFIADDYSSETEALVGLYADYEPYVPTETYVADQSRYFTHTVQGPRSGGFWNRTLDYLFTNGDFVDLSGTVHQDKASGGIETMKLSDHAPVEVELVWP